MSKIYKNTLKNINLIFLDAKSFEKQKLLQYHIYNVALILFLVYLHFLVLNLAHIITDKKYKKQIV